MSSSSRRFRPDANEQQARSRARRDLAEHPEYRAAITANPALQQVMDLALVAQIRQMYIGRRAAHQAALEGQIADARAGGLSTTALEASRRPRPRRGAGRRAALRPALVANLAGPRHIYVAFIHAFIRSNYADRTVGTVLPLLRAEFPNLHLPDV